MKIKLNDEILYEIADWELKVLANDLHADLLISDIKRRLIYIITHKIDQCWNRFEKQWMEVLRNDPSVKSIPKSKKEFVEAILKRDDYKDRKDRGD